VIATAVFVIAQTPIGWLTGKRAQEFFGLYFMVATALIATYCYWRARGLLPKMLAALTGALFLREWHFWGTSEAFYVAFAGLSIWAYMRRDDLAEWLHSAASRGLLAGAFWTYAISQILDRHFLLSLPGYLSWHNNIEETLETSGHVMVLALVVLTYRAALAGAIGGQTGGPKAAA
jgi:hypothetical protein